MKKLIILISVFIFFASACSQERPIKQQKGLLAGQCIGVNDGDTFTLITQNQKEYKIRLAHIDCPEKGQDFGNKAKLFTSQFCYGRQVTIKYNPKKPKDRNGRVIGVVLNAAGQELNMSLVEAGLAWHFKKYSDNVQYAEAETKAQKAKVGLWVLSNPVPPWEWRKRK